MREACALYERLAATDPARYRVVDRRSAGEHEAAEQIRAWIHERRHRPELLPRAVAGPGSPVHVLRQTRGPSAGMNQAARPSICPDPAPARSCVAAIPAGIEAMVFDFDGTLADTTPSHEQTLRAALQPHGLDLDLDLDLDRYRRHVGLSIHDLLATLPSGRQLPHDEIIQQSLTYMLATDQKIPPADGARPSHQGSMMPVLTRPRTWRSSNPPRRRRMVSESSSTPTITRCSITAGCRT